MVSHVIFWFVNIPNESGERPSNMYWNPKENTTKFGLQQDKASCSELFFCAASFPHFLLAPSPVLRSLEHITSLLLAGYKYWDR